MWLWAEPVIADCASEWYGRILPNRFALSIMARKQCSLWRAVIHDQAASVPLVSEELRRTAASFGLDQAALDDVNAVILEELVDIVLCRFRASKNATKTFSLVLMSATSCLGPMRAAA